VSEAQLAHDVHFSAFLCLVSSHIQYQRREKEEKKFMTTTIVM